MSNVKEDINLQIGMAKVYVNGQEIGRQANAAELTASPMFINVDLYDLPHYDKLLEGWDTKLQVELYEEDYNKMKMMMPLLEEVKGDGSQVNGLTDGKLWQRVRDKTMKIVVHPAQLEDDVTDYDITIYKAFPTAEYKKTYGKDVSTAVVTFQGLARTSDPYKASNYFCIGEDRLSVRPLLMDAETNTTGNEIEVVFNEKIDPNTIDKSKFILTGTEAQIGEVVIDDTDDEGKTLVLKLSGNVEVSESVELKLEYRAVHSYTYDANKVSTIQVDNTVV